MKKILMMVLSLVLVAALSIGGTVAYLQNEDSDVNVMTLGSVKIEQHEYEREVDENGDYVTDSNYGYKLKDFTQGKPLLPATEIDANGQPYNYGAGDYGSTRVKMSQVGSHGSMDVFVNENAQDKFVTVENTGRSDAYVRTIIAMEIGSLTEARFDEVISTSSFMTDQGVWKVTDIGIVEIDNNNYYVSEYIYNGAKSLGGVHENGVLPAGDTTYPSLAQVYMTGTSTNEDVEKIDGNKNGTYDILVLSQAVQTAGFDNAATALETAFPKGTDNVNVATWFKGVLTALPEGIPVATVVDVTESVSTITWNDQLGLIPTDRNQQLDVVYKYECPDEALCDPKYDAWYCDFYVSVSEDIDAGQIVLGGNYGTFGWIGFDAPAVSGNTEIALLASAFGGELVGRGAENDPYWTYANIKGLVDTFLCGVAEATGATQNLSGVTFTVNLSLTNPADSSEYYNVNTVTYTFK